MKPKPPVWTVAVIIFIGLNGSARAGCPAGYVERFDRKGASECVSEGYLRTQEQAQEAQERNRALKGSSALQRERLKRSKIKEEIRQREFREKVLREQRKRTLRQR